MDTFMCRECNENCHGKAEDFTVCSACRVGYEAEIERLKAELFTMRNVFHQQDAEIERLRAALERIANPITDDEVHWINTDEIVSIAREALTRN